jgi:hypothetical protein
MSFYVLLDYCSSCLLLELDVASKFFHDVNRILHAVEDVRTNTNCDRLNNISAKTLLILESLLQETQVKTHVAILYCTSTLSYLYFLKQNFA